MSSEDAAERLDRLGLAGAGRSVRIAAEAHVHALREREIALVGELRVHQLGRVALILVRVEELGVAHAYAHQAALVVEVEAQLALPRPVGRVGAASGLQLLDHVHVVDDVHDERLVLELEEGAVGRLVVVHARVLVEDGAQRVEQRLQLASGASTERLLAALGERDTLGEAEYLRRILVDVVVAELALRLAQAGDEQLLERALHLGGELIEPALDLMRGLHLAHERHELALERAHGHDVLVALVELDLIDAGEELLQVRLYDERIGRLAEYLEQVVVADEVEARKHGPLVLEELVERLLAPLQLIDHALEARAYVLALNDGDDARVAGRLGHDVAQVVVDALEARLLLGQRAASEYRLQVDPLALHLVEVVQALVESAELLLPHADLVLEVLVVGRVLERGEQRLVVAHLAEEVLPVLDDGHLGRARVLELGRGELSARRPQLELAQRLAYRVLALRAHVELLDRLRLAHDLQAHAQQVAERELLQTQTARHLQHAEELEPVLGRQRLAAHPLETRRELFVRVDLALDLQLHRARLGTRRRRRRRRLRFIALFLATAAACDRSSCSGSGRHLLAQSLLPHLQELLELVGLGAERDPVLFGEVLDACLELFVDAPHRLDLANVGVHLEQLLELGHLDLKVLAFLSSQHHRHIF